MLILTLRTDKPEAELGLYEDHTQLDYMTWEAHRQLAETLHHKLKELLDKNDVQLEHLEGIVAYKGPGSFTGLRIGLSVANALAKSIPTAVIGSTGDDWQMKGIEGLVTRSNDSVVIPEYGAPVHITQPRK